MKFPKKITIGGQDIEVREVEQIDSKLGRTSLAGGYIEIANSFSGKQQSQTSKENTYWHEVIHCILDTMGENELSLNEKFVSSFAGFLTECYRSMERDKNETNRKQD